MHLCMSVGVPCLQCYGHKAYSAVYMLMHGYGSFECAVTLGHMEIKQVEVHKILAVL